MFLKLDKKEQEDVIISDEGFQDMDDGSEPFVVNNYIRSEDLFFLHNFSTNEKTTRKN